MKPRYRIPKRTWCYMIIWTVVASIYFILTAYGIMFLMAHFPFVHPILFIVGLVLLTGFITAVIAKKLLK